MQIEQNILITYGGISKKIRKGECLFSEGESPQYYFQVITGEVRLYSSSATDKELIQGTFKTGQSFGEPPLLLGRPYPSTAQANKESIIIRLRKDAFLSILKDFPETKSALLHTFAERIYHKATTHQILIANTPEEKISQFLTKYKNEEGLKNGSLIPFTRQQIANMTGLRTETVIRTLKRMHEEGKVKIKNHKLFII